MTRKKTTSKSNAKTTERTSSTRKAAKAPAATKKASRSPKLSPKQRKAVKETYNREDADVDSDSERPVRRDPQRIRVDITGYAFCDDTDIPEESFDEHGGAREAAEHALGGAELHLVIDGISFTICLEPA